MNEFKNERCPVCGELLLDDDDIVVCPDCGAPHHRECWFEKNRCAFSELHADGYVWQSQTQKIIGRLAADEQEQIRRDEEKEKSRLSDDVEIQNDFEHIYIDTINAREAKEDDEIEGVKIRDYIMFMGLGAHYYLPVFYRMSKTKSFVSFNLSAGILAPLNQYYRRMNLFGALVCLVMFIVSLPMLLYAAAGQFEGVKLWLESLNVTDEFLINVQSGFSYISFAVTIALCLFSDRVYFGFVTKKIRALREKYTDNEEYREAIVREGRPSLLRMAANIVISVLIMTIIAYLVVVAAQKAFAPQA